MAQNLRNNSGRTNKDVGFDEIAKFLSSVDPKEFATVGRGRGGLASEACLNFRLVDSQKNRAWFSDYVRRFREKLIDAATQYTLEKRVTQDKDPSKREGDVPLFENEEILYVTRHDTLLDGRDFNTLRRAEAVGWDGVGVDPRWISNRVIDVCAELFADSFEDRTQNFCYVPADMSTVSLDEGFSGPTWLADVNLSEKAVVFFPYLTRIGNHPHWTLLKVYFSERRLVYMNPLGETAEELDDMLTKFCAFLGKRDSYSIDKVPHSPSEWKVGREPHSKQMDSFNCGVFVIRFIENEFWPIAEGSSFNPHQYRMQLAKMILDRKYSPDIDSTGMENVCGIPLENPPETPENFGAVDNSSSNLTDYKEANGQKSPSIQVDGDHSAFSDEDDLYPDLVAEEEDFAEEAGSSGTLPFKKKRNYLTPAGQFEISSHDWALIYVNGKIVPDMWHLTLRFLLMLSLRPCVISFKTSGRFNPSTNDFTGYCYCRHEGCRWFRVLIKEQESGGAQGFVFSDGSELHHEGGPLATQLRGLEREIVRKDLRNSHATAYRFDEIQKVDQQLVIDGNAQKVRTEAQLRQLRHEELKGRDFAKDDCDDLVQRMKAEMKKPVEEQYLQKVSVPLEALMFCLKVIRCLPSAGLTLFFDATGSLVRKACMADKRVYYYAGIVNVEGSPIPVLEMISSHHDSDTIGGLFGKFKKFCLKHELPWPLFSRVVVDYSFATINAIMLDWNSRTLINYLRVMYRYFIKKETSTDIKNITFVKLCRNHFMHMAKRDIIKLTKSSLVIGVALDCVAMLISAKTIEDFQNTFKIIVTLFCCDWEGEDVLAAKRDLCNRATRAEPIDIHMHSDAEDRKDFDRFQDEEVDEICGLLKSSPFRKHFSNILEEEIEFMENQSQSGNQTENVFFLPKFCKNLLVQKYSGTCVMWADCFTRPGDKVIVSSNADVENWHKIVKKSIVKGETKLKIGRFIQLMNDRVAAIEIAERTGLKAGQSKRNQITDLLKQQRRHRRTARSGTNNKSAAKKSATHNTATTTAHSAPAAACDSLADNCNTTVPVSSKKGTNQPEERRTDEEKEICAPMLKIATVILERTDVDKLGCEERSAENIATSSTVSARNRTESCVTEGNSIQHLGSQKKTIILAQNIEEYDLENKNDPDDPLSEELWKPKKAKRTTHFNFSRLKAINAELCTPVDVTPLDIGNAFEEVIISSEDDDLSDSDMHVYNDYDGEAVMYLYSGNKSVIWNDFFSLCNGCMLSNAIVDACIYTVVRDSGNATDHFVVRSDVSAMAFAGKFDQSFELNKVDLNLCKSVLMPLPQPEKWMICVLDFTANEFWLLDPTGKISRSEEDAYSQSIQKFLIRRRKFNKEKGINPFGWKSRRSPYFIEDDINRVDSGVYVVYYVECLVNNRDIGKMCAPAKMRKPLRKRCESFRREYEMTRYLTDKNGIFCTNRVTLRNGLFDDVSFYAQKDVTTRYVVGKFNGVFLEAEQLRTLVDTGSKLTSSIIDICAHVLYSLNKNAEVFIMTCEQSRLSICTQFGDSLDMNNVNFGTKTVVMPLNLGDDHWRAMIADFKTKQLLVLDPLDTYRYGKENNPLETKFYNFLRRRNTFTSYPVDVNGWSVDNTHDYCRQKDGVSCGVFTIFYIDCVLQNNYGAMRSDAAFNPHAYRIDLGRALLRNSDDMTNMCLLCGKEQRRRKGTVKMDQCRVCGRWVHQPCLHDSLGIPLYVLRDDNFVYVCEFCQKSDSSHN